jgi:hypothetical protein
MRRPPTVFYGSYLFAGVSALLITVVISLFWMLPEYRRYALATTEAPNADRLATLAVGLFAGCALVWGAVSLIVAIFAGRGSRAARVLTWIAAAITIAFCGLLLWRGVAPVPWFTRLNVALNTGMIALSAASIVLLAMPASSRYYRELRAAALARRQALRAAYHPLPAMPGPFPAMPGPGYPPRPGMAAYPPWRPGMPPPPPLTVQFTPGTVTPSGMVAPGVMPPGTVPPPGTAPPGAMPPGVMPPGMMPPGTVPPLGTVAPGVTPPGMMPPGQVPPSQPLPESAAPGQVAPGQPPPESVAPPAPPRSASPDNAGNDSG